MYRKRLWSQHPPGNQLYRPLYHSASLRQNARGHLYHSLPGSIYTFIDVLCYVYSYWRFVSTNLSSLRICTMQFLSFGKRFPPYSSDLVHDELKQILSTINIPIYFRNLKFIKWNWTSWLKTINITLKCVRGLRKEKEPCLKFPTNYQFAALISTITYGEE